MYKRTRRRSFTFLETKCEKFESISKRKSSSLVFLFFSLSLSLSNESRVNSSTTLVSPLSSRPSLATRHSPPLVIHPSFSVVSPTPHRTRFFSYSSAFPLSFPPAWSLQFSSPSPPPLETRPSFLRALSLLYSRRRRRCWYIISMVRKSRHARRFR